MRTWRLGVLVGAAMISFSARAGTVLFSTNGTADPGFLSTSGDTATRSGAFTIAFAMQFSSLVTASLDSIDVAVTSAGGITSDTFIITTDSSGVPGSQLDALSVPVTSSNALQTANSTNHPVLTAGTLYWLEMLAPATNGSVRWDLASPTVTGRNWNSSGGSSSNQSLAAFAIIGTPTPEPGSIALILTGALCLTALRKIRV